MIFLNYRGEVGDRWVKKMKKNIANNIFISLNNR